MSLIYDNIADEVEQIYGDVWAGRGYDSIGRLHLKSYTSEYHELAYNNKSQVEHVVYADFSAISSWFDDRGNLFGWQSSAKQMEGMSETMRTTFDYDNIGQLQTITDTINFTKGNSGESTSYVLPRQIVYDEHLNQVREYRVTSQLKSERRGHRMRWARDTIGRIVETQDFLNFKTTNTYDDYKGILQRQHTASSDGELKRSVTYHYTDFDMLSGYSVLNRQLGALIETEFSYDSNMQVSQIRYSYASWKPPYKVGHFQEIEKISYRYDSFSRMVGRQTEKKTETFEYDEFNQLTRYTCDQPGNSHDKLMCPKFPNDLGMFDVEQRATEIRYEYNYLKNMVQVNYVSMSKMKMSMTREFKSADPHKLTRVRVALTSENNNKLYEHNYGVEHDARGNIVKIQNQSSDDWLLMVAYDVLNRPSFVKHKICSSPNNVVTWMVARLFDSQDRMFYQATVVDAAILDGQGKEAAWLLNTPDGAPSAFLSDRRSNCSLSTTLSAQSGFVCHDRADSREFLLDSMGSVIGSIRKSSVQDAVDTTYYSYGPFGSCDHYDDHAYNIRFHNIPTDRLDMAVTMNGRLFVPWLYQFLQRDSLTPLEGGEMNPYNYAANSPMQRSDASGDYWVFAGAGAMGRMVMRSAIKGVSMRALVRPKFLRNAMPKSISAPGKLRMSSAHSTLGQAVSHVFGANRGAVQSLISPSLFTNDIAKLANTCFSAAMAAAIQDAASVHGDNFFVDLSYFQNEYNQMLQIYGTKVGTKVRDYPSIIEGMTRGSIKVAMIDNFVSDEAEFVTRRTLDKHLRPMFGLRHRSWFGAIAGGITQKMTAGGEEATGGGAHRGHVFYYSKRTELIHNNYWKKPSQAQTDRYIHRGPQFGLPGYAYKRLQIWFLKYVKQ